MTRRFAAYLALVGAGLLLGTQPGFFTIDEPNHLAMVASLRHGRLTLPGLEGISASDELAFFNARRDMRPSSPPVHDLPPWYAVIALPFSELGVRGLIGLNSLSFLATAALLFAFVRRHAAHAHTPWLAALAFMFASHSLEYALGVWPHSLSVLLCTGALLLGSRSRTRDDLRLAFAAGLLGGLAAGVRYPNIVYALCVGFTLCLWAPRRLESGISFGFGLSLPLFVASAINNARLDTWNPISKGGPYLDFVAQRLSSSVAPAAPRAVQTASWQVPEWLRTTWFRLVDYSAQPPMSYIGFELQPNPESGAYVFLGVVKKAWLQSSPWVALALLFAVLAWLPVRTPPEQADRQRDLRAAAMPILLVLAMFATTGITRTDGICFNQRYFLDLVPVACAILALRIESLRLPLHAAAFGLASGLAVGAAALFALEGPVRELAQMRIPLVLAAGTLVAWMMRERTLVRPLLAALLGASLAWSAAIHLGSDVRTSLAARAEVADARTAAEGRLPDGSAVLVWSNFRSAIVAEQLERDLVIVDCARDEGRDASRLAVQLMARGRRVFILANGFPRPQREKLMTLLGTRQILRGKIVFIELSAARVRHVVSNGVGASRQPRASTP